MDDGNQLSWIIIAVFLLGAFYFAIAETAFASVSKIRLRALMEIGDSRAKNALYVLENFDQAVTTILIGTNVTHLGIASLVTVIVVNTWGMTYVSIATIITTIAVFFFSEMLPKSIAKRYCDRLSLTTASSLIFFMKILKPLAFILTKIGQTAAALIGKSDEVSVTEEELHVIIEDLTDDGVLSEDQSDLMSSALEFDEIKVDSILTARVDMDALEINTPPEQVVEFLLSHRHSRYPVYEGTIDHVVGTLQMRKYLKEYRKNKTVSLRSLIDAPFFVHYTVSVADLLRELNSQKVSVAIVLDDWGGTYGLTTAEDALEELVGEIWDEEDIVAEAVTAVNEHKYLVNADCTLADIFEGMALELDLDDEEEGFEYKRASEWAFGNFTHIPKPGDSFTFRNLTVTVERMRRNRIIQLSITIAPVAVEGGAQA